LLSTRFRTSLSTFGGRLGFYALLGLLAAIVTNMSYWNWYGFPVTYTAAYLFTGWMGYLCAGLVAAAMKLAERKPQPPSSHYLLNRARQQANATRRSCV